MYTFLVMTAILALGASQECSDPNAQHKICGNGCKMTCQNRHKSMTCSSECKPGCYCKDGFILDEVSNLCLPPDQCTNNGKRCGPNEIYLKCGTTCPMTCENWARNHIPCDYRCEEGCFCSDGYVRDTTTNACVKKENCSKPPMCGRNEIFKREGSNCATCSNPQASCPIQKVPSCYCKDDFFRDSTGNCVDKRMCDVENTCEKKDPNSEYAVCIGCLNSCSIWEKPNNCSSKCTPGCKCKSGYFLNAWGRCVPLDYCFSQSPYHPPAQFHMVGAFSTFSETELPDGLSNITNPEAATTKKEEGSQTTPSQETPSSNVSQLTKPSDGGPESAPEKTADPSNSDNETSPPPASAIQAPGGQPGGAQTAGAQPAGAQPAGTQPPATQPPETQPPVTQPPATQPPATQAPTTQATWVSPSNWPGASNSPYWSNPNWGTSWTGGPNWSGGPTWPGVPNWSTIGSFAGSTANPSGGSWFTGFYEPDNFGSHFGPVSPSFSPTSPGNSPSYGSPPPGFSSPSPGYGSPTPGYGSPSSGFGSPSPSYGSTSPGYVSTVQFDQPGPVNQGQPQNVNPQSNPQANPQPSPQTNIQPNPQPNQPNSYNPYQMPPPGFGPSQNGYNTAAPRYQAPSNGYRGFNQNQQVTPNGYFQTFTGLSSSPSSIIGAFSGSSTPSGVFSTLSPALDLSDIFAPNTLVDDPFSFTGIGSSPYPFQILPRSHGETLGSRSKLRLRSKPGFGSKPGSRSKPESRFKLGPRSKPGSRSKLRTRSKLGRNGKNILKMHVNNKKKRSEERHKALQSNDGKGSRRDHGKNRDRHTLKEHLHGKKMLKHSNDESRTSTEKDWTNIGHSLYKDGIVLKNHSN